MYKKASSRTGGSQLHGWSTRKQLERPVRGNPRPVTLDIKLTMGTPKLIKRGTEEWKRIVGGKFKYALREMKRNIALKIASGEDLPPFELEPSVKRRKKKRKPKSDEYQGKG